MSLQEQKLRVVLSAGRICEMHALEKNGKFVPAVLWRMEARILARRAFKLWLTLKIKQLGWPFDI